MGRLLNIEWLKIRRYKAFFWLFGIFIVSVFGVNYIVSKTIGLVGEEVPETAMVLGRPFDFPMVWHTVCYLTGFLLFIPGLLVIMFTSNEYGFRTARQSVIDGLSRREFILSKILLIGAFAVFLTGLVFVVSLIYGLSQGGSFTTHGMHFLGYFFLQSLMDMSVAFVLVMLFRRSGIAIGIYFLYAFIVENLIALIINYNIKAGMGYFLPLKSVNKLIPAPSHLASVMDVGTPQAPGLLAAAVVWIGLMLWFCLGRFRRSDL
ncbi:MAG: ABC transporter permease [Rikenellaceae bacterium]|nr:ABC transporter permease [Rikenellaceae bacterium]